MRNVCGEKEQNVEYELLTIPDIDDGEGGSLVAHHLFIA